MFVKETIHLRNGTDEGHFMPQPIFYKDLQDLKQRTDASLISYMEKLVFAWPVVVCFKRKYILIMMTTGIYEAVLKVNEIVVINC